MSGSKKSDRTGITINIAMPSDTHHRLTIACAVMRKSLKDALIAGAQMWIDQHAAEVTAATGHIRLIGAESAPPMLPAAPALGDDKTNGSPPHE